METTYYTLTAREIIVTGDGVEQVSGGSARHMVYLRKGGAGQIPPKAGGKVIDLAAWKAAREEALPAEETCDGWEEALPADRPRRSRRQGALWGAELLATLSVMGTMALLMVRIWMG